MVEWKFLNDICGIYDGTHQTPKYTDSGVKFVSVENINAPYRSQKYISEDDYSRNYKTKPQKGDVLMTRIGDVGTCTVLDNDEPIAYYVSLALLRPNSQLVLSNYVKYILESNIGKRELRKKTLLTAVPLKINLGDVGKLKLPIPSLEEQNRIVGILDTFTASIDNLKEQIAQRRKQYEYYRCCLFSTEKWAENKIGELTKIFSCPRVFKDQWQDSGVPFWRSSDIMSYHNGVINPRGEVYISQSLYEELSSKSDKIKEGDILVTGGGSIGIPYLKKDNSPLFVKDADLICIQKCTSIIPKYLYHYFLSTDFKMYLKRITHDATIAHYTINQIKDTPIPLPPLSEQQRIVSILDTFEASIQNLEAQLSQREKQYEYYRNKLLTFE